MSKVNPVQCHHYHDIVERIERLTSIIEREHREQDEYNVRSIM